MGRDGKQTLDVERFTASIDDIMDRIQQSIFDRAYARMTKQIHEVSDIQAAHDIFAKGEAVQVMMPSSLLDDPLYKTMQDEFSVTSRCLPFKYNGEKVLVGKAY